MKICQQLRAYTVRNTCRKASRLAAIAACALSAAGSPDLASAEWKIQTIDREGSVGTCSSIAIDRAGNPRIAYWDESHDFVKYAEFTASGWQISYVERSGSVGGELSLVLDNLNFPYVGYQDFKTGIRLATGRLSSWKRETVAELENPSPFVPIGVAVALDGRNRPNVAFWDPDLGLRFARRTDAETWYVQTIDGTFVDQLDMKLDPVSGAPQISYRAYADDGSSLVKYARIVGDAWVAEIVANVGLGGGDSSIALDSAGRPKIAFADGSENALRFAERDGESDKWTFGTIDGVASWYPSLILDHNQHPHITYGDFEHKVLRYAFHDGRGWSSQRVAEFGDFCSSLAVDQSGRPHISFYNRNDTVRDLLYATPGEPSSAENPPELLIRRVVGNNVLLSLKCRQGASYAVRRSVDLENWSTIEEGINGSGSMQIIDTIDVSIREAYYRAETE